MGNREDLIVVTKKCIKGTLYRILLWYRLHWYHLLGNSHAEYGSHVQDYDIVIDGIREGRRQNRIKDIINRACKV